MRGPFANWKAFNPKSYIEDSSGDNSPVSLEYERTKDDKEIELMCERQEEMDIENEMRQGVFIAHWATSAHLVPIYILAGHSEIQSHTDMDIYMWLPRSPFCLDHLTDVSECRHTVILRDSETAETLHYIVAYYDQVEDTDLSPRDINLLINLLTEDSAMQWQESVLILRIDESGAVVNADDSDVARCPAILKSFLDSVF